jgi:hypothetical protein
MLDLSRAVLERKISDVGQDRRKKTKFEADSRLSK